MKHLLSSDAAYVTAESTFLPGFCVAVPGQEFFGGIILTTPQCII